MAIFKKNKKQDAQSNHELEQKQRAADLEKIKQEFSDVFTKEQEAPKQRSSFVNDRYQYTDAMQNAINYLEKRIKSLTTPEQKADYINKRMEKLSGFRRKCVRQQVNRQLLAKFDDLIEHFKNPLQNEKVDKPKHSQISAKSDTSIKEEKEERKAQLRKDHWEEFGKAVKPREDASKVLEKFREERFGKGKESVSMEEESSEHSPPKLNGN